MKMFLIGAALAVTAGVAVAAVPERPDPYIWLEQVSSPQALDWVKTENARALSVLEADPRFAGLQAEALKIGEATDKVPVPQLIHGQVYNFWQDATHVRGIWRTTSLADFKNAAPAWRTVIDLDALSTAEKANWVWKGADCEPVAEQRCLVHLSDGGEDAVTVREFDLKAGAFVPGGFTLPISKQDSSWVDADTLLVARDWGPGTMTASGYAFVVKRLKRGQPLSAAVEVFRGQSSDVLVGAASFVDAGGHRLTLILRRVSFFEGETYAVTAKGVVKLDLPAKSDPVGLVDGKLIVRVNQPWTPAGGAAVPTGSIVAVDAAALATGKPARPVLVFAPGPRQSVDEVDVSKSRVVAAIYDNVRGRALSFALVNGVWAATPVPLPDNVSVGLVSTERSSDAMYLRVAGFLDPTTIWQGDAASATAAIVKTLPARFDASRDVVEQFEVTSKDGTKIPYFVVHRRDIVLDGSTPMFLTAYGGFQVSRTPAYEPVGGKLWIERGGAYALANIRGGGEFGPAWHEAGLKTNRQRIYDDFAAVGEDMIARKITSPRRLGIAGGSNGGLLMGVEMIQRPDLWHAVYIGVPLLDMLRFEQIAAGASWVGEYGSVSVPAERAFLASISPYNTLQPGGKYPEPLIFTTTKDDRVGPVHARKFAARMKEFGLPYLYYENTEGGHSPGANLKQTAHSQALEWVYFMRKLMDGDSVVATVPALAGTRWRVEDVAGGGVIDNAELTVEFTTDRVAGRSGCNRYGGAYRQTGGAISFTPMMGTRMACPPALMALEAKMLAVLQAATSVSVDASGAVVLAAPDGRRLKLRKL